MAALHARTCWGNQHRLLSKLPAHGTQAAIGSRSRLAADATDQDHRHKARASGQADYSPATSWARWYSPRRAAAQYPGAHQLDRLIRA